MPAAQTPTRGSGIPNIKFAVIAGGAAGNLTVTGIRKQDRLMQVLDITDKADMTAEFTLTAANTINNTGGTATTGDTLLVVWYVTPTGLAG